MRSAKAFIPELDFVAIYNNEIIGNIVYAESKIVDRNQEYIVLTFGPLSVLPKHQNKGVGTALIEHTKLLATAMRYKAIIIYGDPEYYKRFGFKVSKEYNITNNDGKYPVALLVLELYPNALIGIKGKFNEGEIYEINKEELEEYEKRFIKKEKETTKTQDRFNELVEKYL
jgi:predicted N-acetyltransferase YhbS